MKTGKIIILNGAPRSGKSSLVAAIQETFEEPWMNLGVDVFVERIAPPRYRPGIGLRPGGERAELEPLVPVFYAALYEAVAAFSRLGLNVVVDVGHHDAFAVPRNILVDSAKRLTGLPVLFVGVRCPVDVIMERRDKIHVGREDAYLRSSPNDPVPRPVILWREEVHKPGIYDLEVDTSVLDPRQCALAIATRLREPAARPSAFERIAAGAAQG